MCVQVINSVGLTVTTNVIRENITHRALNPTLLRWVVALPCLANVALAIMPFARMGSIAGTVAMLAQRQQKPFHQQNLHPLGLVREVILSPSRKTKTSVSVAQTRSLSAKQAVIVGTHLTRTKHARRISISHLPPKNQKNRIGGALATIETQRRRQGIGRITFIVHRRNVGIVTIDSWHRGSG